MYKVRLLGRLTLPENPRRGGHLSKAELEEMLAIVSMLSTVRMGHEIVMSDGLNY